MTNKNLNKYANKLVNAFLNDKIINPLPINYTKKLSDAQKLRNFQNPFNTNKSVSRSLIEVSPS